MAGVRAIEFPGGGEPTTHPQFGAIIEAFAGSDLPLGLVTNGQLAERILPVAKAFEWIRVSLDAGDAATFARMHGVDRFQTIVDGIRRLANASATIGVGFLVTPTNWRSAPLAVPLLRTAGVRYLQFRPASLVAWEGHDDLLAAINCLGALQEQADGFVVDSSWKWDALRLGRSFPTCETSSLVGIIKADGSVPFCCLKRDTGPVFGSIIDKSFTDVWFSGAHADNFRGVSLTSCPSPCKHDSYNAAYFALQAGSLNENFL